MMIEQFEKYAGQKICWNNKSTVAIDKPKIMVTCSM